MKKTKIVVSASCFAILFAVFLYYYNTSPLFPVENDCTHLYYKNWSGVFIEIPRDCGFLGCFGPDIRPFKYERLWGASPRSFKVIQCGSSTGDVLATDLNTVFYGGKRVPGGDPDSLEIVEAGAKTYAKDKNKIYLQGSVNENNDEWKGVFLDNRLLRKEDGLYIADRTDKPTKLGLADHQTFKMLPVNTRIDGKWYVAEDKNFYFLPNGGSYWVDPKPETKDFERLGCGYYKFEGRVFFNLYEIPDVDIDTFKVLKTRRDAQVLSDRCDRQYAIDKSHRWEFQIPVRPGDQWRNGRIESLLKLAVNQ